MRRKLRRIGPRPLLFVRYVAHHALTRVRQRFLRRTYGRKIARVPGGATLRVTPIDLPGASELPEPLAAPAARLRAEADDVSRGTVDYLGSGPVSLDPLDWHRDFKSGYRWPQVFYQDVEVTRLDDTSDAKVVWELSRCHHLLTLARAARLFEDERYVSVLEAQLESWLAANPPGVGINWSNPMEVAIRAVNLVWIVATLEPSRPLSAELRRRLTESLQAHGRHIAANLEGTPLLRSNHYLSDVVGLLVVGATIVGDPHAPRWFRFAHRALEREIRRQTHSDGVGFEASLPYHGLALELFLIARYVARQAGSPFSDRYDARLRKMLDVSAAVRHPNGRVPQFGDGDSGRVLPAGFGRPATHDHLLWLGSAEAGVPVPLEVAAHEEVAWTLGFDAWTAAQGADRREDTGSRAFEEGGLYVLRGAAAHVVVRCGDLGQDGNGGHGHNDLLSFEGSWNGEPVVVDSGTYAYTSDPDARNAFRSTAAHSTVIVDGAEINPIDPQQLFALDQVANPRLKYWSRDHDQPRLRVSHDGYRRLASQTIVDREFALDPGTGELEITDSLTGKGEARIDWRLHLAPGARVDASGDFDFEITGPGGSRIALQLEALEAARIEEGWVSSQFGVRERAPVIAASAVADLPAKITATFAPVPSRSPQHAGRTIERTP